MGRQWRRGGSGGWDQVRGLGFIPRAVGSITSRALSRGAASCHRQFREVALEAGLDVLTRKNIQDRFFKKKGTLPNETRRTIPVMRKQADKTQKSE